MRLHWYAPTIPPASTVIIAVDGWPTHERKPKSIRLKLINRKLSAYICIVIWMFEREKWPVSLETTTAMRSTTHLFCERVTITEAQALLCECANTFVQCSILIASFAFVKFYDKQNTHNFYFSLFVLSHLTRLPAFTLIPFASKSKFELNSNQSHLIFCISNLSPSRSPVAHSLCRARVSCVRLAIWCDYSVASFGNRNAAEYLHKLKDESIASSHRKCGIVCDWSLVRVRSFHSRGKMESLKLLCVLMLIYVHTSM